YVNGITAFSPDGRLLAIANSKWDVQLIDPTTGRQVATLPNPEYQEIHAFTFSPDGSQLAVTSSPTEHDGGSASELHLMDLRAIRGQLAQLGFDWELPPYPAPPSWEGGRFRPLKVQLDLGGQLFDRDKYSLVLAFFPFHAEAYFQRGRACLQIGQLAAA